MMYRGSVNYRSEHPAGAASALADIWVSSDEEHSEAAASWAAGVAASALKECGADTGKINLAEFVMQRVKAQADASQDIALLFSLVVHIYKDGYVVVPSGPDVGGIDWAELRGLVISEATKKIALQVTNAAAALIAKRHAPELAKQIWEVLRTAPYDAFSDEPCDALRSASSAADAAINGPQLALNPPRNAPAGTAEVFPLLALALGALHEITNPNDSITSTYNDWAE